MNFPAGAKPRRMIGKKFAEHLDSMEAELDQEQSYMDLSDKLAQMEKQWSADAQRICYLACLHP